MKLKPKFSIAEHFETVKDPRIERSKAHFLNGHAAENFTILRHLALSALNQEKTAKLGVKNKRHRAGWDNDYLLKVLAE